MNLSRLKEPRAAAAAVAAAAAAEEKRDTCRLGRPSAMRPLLLAGLLFAAALTTGRAESEPPHHMVRQLMAPAIVDPRIEKVVLRCDYDLHGKPLYSVNWFKNDKVLFRYSPSLTPKGLVYENEDVEVQVSPELSNGEQLVLLGYQDIRKNMRSYEGTYTCEVSTERPFLTDYGMANVSVAIIPKGGPALEGLQHNYQVGEQLDADCTSAPSLPPAELTFYLNNQKIDGPYVQRKKSQHAIGESSVISRLSISLRLERQHFPGGALSLVCQATLPGITLPKILRSEKTATLAASNQRLAQEPPKLGASAGSASEINSGIGLLMLLMGLAGLF